MIVILIVAAICAGTVASVLLWPLGPIVALLAAPFAASAAVLFGAFIIAFCAPGSSGEPISLTHSLMQVLGRRNNR
jgi:hypothetical protein